MTACKETHLGERFYIDPRDGLTSRIAPDRCESVEHHHGADTTAAVLRLLREAARLLPLLPTDRRQNYEVHRAMSDLDSLVRSLTAGLCEDCRR